MGTIPKGESSGFYMFRSSQANEEDFAKKSLMIENYPISN